MESHRETMRRTVSLVQEASFAIDEIIRKEVDRRRSWIWPDPKSKVKELAWRSGPLWSDLAY